MPPAERKIVLLDLDGFIHRSHDSLSLTSKNAVDAMIRAGLNASPGEALDKLQAIYARNPNSARHYQSLVQYFNGKPNFKIISAGIAAHHQTKKGALKLRAGAVGLLEFLRKNNLEYYLVTDGIPKKQWDKIHYLGLEDYFDSNQLISTRSSFWSSLARYSSNTLSRDASKRAEGWQRLREKKAVPFYKYVLYKIGVKPKLGRGKYDYSTIVVAGDKESSDVIPPKKLGLTAIRLNLGKYRRGPSQADLITPLNPSEVKTLGLDQTEAKSFEEIISFLKKHFGVNA